MIVISQFIKQQKHNNIAAFKRSLYLVSKCGLKEFNGFIYTSNYLTEVIQIECMLFLN